MLGMLRVLFIGLVPLFIWSGQKIEQVLGAQRAGKRRFLFLDIRPLL